MISLAKAFRPILIATALSALLAVGASAAPLGAGTVTADALRLRAVPTTEGDILVTVNSGASVVVLADNGDGWYQVNYNAVEGFMSGEYLTVAPISDAVLGCGKVNTDGATLNMRSAASTESNTLISIPGGTVLELSGVDNGWYKVTYSGQTGYVSSDYILLTSAPATSATSATSAPSGKGQEVVAYAKQYLGTSYVLGGNGPNSFDCSGFVKYVYANFGYSLNRTATNQLQNGVSISKDQLQPGDLVFFRYRTSKPVSHVGIYIGGGQFIHASTNNYEVCIDDLSSGHYANVYVYGRRILG